MVIGHVSLHQSKQCHWACGRCGRCARGVTPSTRVHGTKAEERRRHYVLLEELDGVFAAVSPTLSAAGEERALRASMAAERSAAEAGIETCVARPRAILSSTSAASSVGIGPVTILPQRKPQHTYGNMSFAQRLTYTTTHE